MTVLAVGQGGAAQNGLYAFDARRHLRQMAELVAAVFADELDAHGRSILHEKATIGRLSPLLGGLLSLAYFSDIVSGFVWQEEGRLVGNVTMQPASETHDRWRISNVAVSPEFRGRGIARRLMLAALREVALRGGTWALLQVRVDNLAAMQLYRPLGFSDVCRDGIWQLPRIPERARHAADEVELRPLPASAWRERLELAKASALPLDQWLAPIYEAEYRPGLASLMASAFGSWLGIRRVQRWGAWQGEQLVAEVETTRSGAGPEHHLRFAVRPDVRGTLETVLVEQGLHDLQGAPPYPVLAEHSGDHEQGVSALEAAGFQRRHILLAMRRMVTPSDAGIRVVMGD